MPTAPSRFLGEIPEEYVEKSGRNYRSEQEEGEGGWQSQQHKTRQRPVFDRGYSVGGGYTGAIGGTQGGRSTAAVGSVEKRPGVSSRPAASLPDFQKGDTVIHKAFGQGLITGLTPMGGRRTGGNRI